jgi:raffinose/stachyose/melibiose transport system substrate-binding protein
MAIALALVLITGLFAACGSSAPSTAAPASEVPAAAPAAPEAPVQAAPVEPVVEAPAENAGLPFEGVTITLNKDSDSADAGVLAVAELAKQKLGLEVVIDYRVSGSDGDNLVKTRLASGDMSDILLYNSGSLLAALNPAEHFVDLSNQPFIDKIDDTFRGTVTIDNATYGIPFQSTQAGGVMYNKAVYSELGLSVPKTWTEFLANCDAIAAAGKDAMIGSFADAWTAQVVFLGDNYNVIAADANFAADFEAGTAKYATNPAGMLSFQKMADLTKYYNSDYLATTTIDACAKLISGEGAHWIMLTQMLTTMYTDYPEQMDDIGVFGLPGDNPDNQGLTVWMPSGLYANKNAENVDAVMAFYDLYLSKEALDAYTATSLPDGPFCVKGYSLPNNAYKAVREDMQAYFDSGKTITALEFMTPVKGPACDRICLEVGSGQVSATQGAADYDEDCKKQALQLGLNWA